MKVFPSELPLVISVTVRVRFQFFSYTPRVPLLPLFHFMAPYGVRRSVSSESLSALIVNRLPELRP